MSAPGDALDARPPRAVVGSQVSYEEEMFGAAFDGAVLRRTWAFIRPHRRRLLLALAAVLAFTATQVALPLLIRLAIDHALAPEAGGLGRLHLVGGAFVLVVLVNYAANHAQEMLVGRTAADLLTDRDLLESARGHLAWVHSDIVHRNLSVYPGLLEEGPTQSPKTEQRRDNHSGYQHAGQRRYHGQLRRQVLARHRNPLEHCHRFGSEMVARVLQRDPVVLTVPPDHRCQKRQGTQRPDP